MKYKSSDGVTAKEVTLQKKKKTPPAGNMKAVRIHEFGGADKLMYEDVPIPQPAPDEVLIHVVASSVNPIDWKIREGHMKDRVKLPLVLGWDAAGIIVGTGDLVNHFIGGDKVFARLDPMHDGAYAEYAVAKASDVAHAPHIPLYESAGVPLAAQTAWAGLFEMGNLKPKQKVLIHGASGGVGTFAVQLAKIAGAYVVATTSAENAELVKALGANEVIDYKKEDFSQMVKDMDLVFDTIGGETQARSWQVIRKGGTLVSTVGADEKEAARHGVTGKSFMVNSSGGRLQEIAALINKHLLRVVIDKEFTLQEVKQAHELSQSGKAKGKIILRVSNEK